MGIGQAFNAPCAYPIIASLFSEETRSTANGIYAVGTYVGSALSSLSIVIAIAFGWRITSLMAGLAGIIAALCLYRTTDSLASGISASTACRLATGESAWLPPTDFNNDVANDENSTDETGKLLPSNMESENQKINTSEPTRISNTSSSSASSDENYVEIVPISRNSVIPPPTLVENITILIKNKPVMLLFGKYHLLSFIWRQLFVIFMLIFFYTYLAFYLSTPPFSLSLSLSDGCLFILIKLHT